MYSNLLRATDNTPDITTEKYGVITKIDGYYCNVKEDDTELEHMNVPILNGCNLKEGSKVVIGFINNSIYNVVCYGTLGSKVESIDDSYSKEEMNQFLDCLIDKLGSDGGDEQSGSGIDVEVDMIFDGVSGRDDSLTLRANIIYV